MNCITSKQILAELIIDDLRALPTVRIPARPRSGPGQHPYGGRTVAHPTPKRDYANSAATRPARPLVIEATVNL